VPSALAARRSPRYSSCNYPPSGRSFISVRQVSLCRCFVILSLPHAYMNDLDIDLDRNTPWVDISACVEFGLDRPSRLAGHTEHRYRQTDKHNAFYYIDDICIWYFTDRNNRAKKHLRQSKITNNFKRNWYSKLHRLTFKTH